VDFRRRNEEILTHLTQLILNNELLNTWDSMTKVWHSFHRVHITTLKLVGKSISQTYTPKVKEQILRLSLTNDLKTLSHRPS
jgi:hypothetical protein